MMKILYEKGGEIEFRSKERKKVSKVIKGRGKRRKVTKTTGARI